LKEYILQKNGLGTSKNKMLPQNKMLGSDPFYFYFIFILFILKGAPASSFYLGTPMGGPLGWAQIAMLLSCSPRGCKLSQGWRFGPAVDTS